jgi:AraC family transcriptional regulator of adaptative response/methylated-DNA-[protein]-cysteine methyltransferase
MQKNRIILAVMAPVDYRERGQGMSVRYGFHPSPFGEVLLAMADQSICGLEFVEPAIRKRELGDLQARWGQAPVIHDQKYTQPFAKRIFSFQKSGGKPFPLLVQGTDFQIKVWQALVSIPSGTLVSYRDIARKAGFPMAARAVGQAVGRNPIAFLIPCHRVIHQDGAIGNYHWGAARKKAMIGWEAD